MASANEFLTKQLCIQRNIVTFRSLSRALLMHVNAAKNELASYHASSKATDEPVYATYLVTGDVTPVNANGSYRDEKGIEMDSEPPELVSTTKIFLVRERELEAAKAQFIRPPSVHIYSLSPSEIRDAALLTLPADDVRSQYASKGKDFHQTVGVVVGADVKVRAYASKKDKASLATSSKLPPPPSDKKPAGKPRPSDDKGKAPEKAKVAYKGALDWSKAKSKPEKEMETSITKGAVKEKDKTGAKTGPSEIEQEKPVSKKESKPSLVQHQASKAVVKKEREASSTGPEKTKIHEKPKRGKKRTSAVMSLSDSGEDVQDNNPTPKTKPRTLASPLPSKPASAKSVRLKKGALISDEEDDTSDTKRTEPSRQKGKGRSRVAVSDDLDELDNSVRTIMDLDDSYFIRNNNTKAEPQAKQEEEEEEVIMHSDSDSVSMPTRVKRKRKPKKEIPIGSNGLPKKRVVKSRKSKDARGYMVTQDYSSYESASESEQAPAPPVNDKKSTKSRQKKAKTAEQPEKPTATSARQRMGRNPKSTGKEEDFPPDQYKKTDDEAEQAPKKSEACSGRGISSTTNVSTSFKGNKNNLMSYFGKK